MIYTPTEYSKLFPFGNKIMSAKSIIRRCKAGLLPLDHKCRKLPGKSGSWVIEVREKVN